MLTVGLKISTLGLFPLLNFYLKRVDIDPISLCISIIYYDLLKATSGVRTAGLLQ